MTVNITLPLSDVIIERAQKLGKATQRDFKSVLADTLEMVLPTLGEIPETSLLPSISTLRDGEIVDLANSKMDSVQNQRLGTLQLKGKEQGLTPDERYELMALLHIYQLGQLRKSEALAEATRRGLRSSVSSPSSI